MKRLRMFVRLLRPMAVAAFCLSVVTIDSLDLRASISTIAITGDPAPGVAGGLFEELDLSATNNSGEVVFAGRLEIGPGGVAASSRDGLWRFDGSSLSLVSRTGAGGVAGAAGANFESYDDFGIDAGGNVFALASLEIGSGGVTLDDREGIWQFSGSGPDSLLVRTADTAAPGVAGGDFESVGNDLRLSGSGRVTFPGQLRTLGDVTGQDNAGVWTLDSTTGSLLARESVSSPPGVTGSFSAFVSPRLNDDDQTVFRAGLKVGGSVTPANAIGIWKYTGASGELVSREGSGSVPEIGGASFAGLGDPAINGLNQVAFSSGLATGGSIGAGNNAGVWLYTGSAGALVAQKGSGGVTGVAGADFATFFEPLLSDSGDVLFKAELVNGVGGVSASDDLGLWVSDDTSSTLVARSGSLGVPGVGGASFADFEQLAINAQGKVLAKATLENGGAVVPANDTGLWLFDPAGTDVLVAREGDSLAGRTIAAVDFLGNSGGNDGRPSALDDQGQVFFQVDFTNGDSGLFQFQFFSADFDGDGDVDSLDLTDPNSGWLTRYGTDLDGLDFLDWQTQFGAGVPLSATVAAVPEPSDLYPFCGTSGCHLFWTMAQLINSSDSAAIHFGLGANQ